MQSTPLTTNLSESSNPSSSIDTTTNNNNDNDNNNNIDNDSTPPSSHRKLSSSDYAAGTESDEERSFTERTRQLWSSCKSYPLFDYSHLPSWLQDNRFIRSGYRVNIGWKNTAQSLCHCHNETVNVWSHLLGFIIVLLLFVVTLSTLSPHGIDRLNVQWRPNKIDHPIRYSNSLAFCPRKSPFSDSLYCIDDQQRPLPLPSDMKSGFHSRIRTVEEVLSLLRERATAINEAMHSITDHGAMMEMKIKLAEYADKVEAQLHQAKKVLTNMGHEAELIEASISSALHDALFHASHTDIVRATRSFIDDFYRQFLFSMHAPLSQKNLTITIEPTPSPQSMDWLLFAFSKEKKSFAGSLHPYLTRFPIAVFLISAMCCLLFSATFHLFQAVSRSMSIILQNLDYAGISLLIAGSNVPVIYYGFYCVPAVRGTYLTIISLLGLIGFIVSISPRFRALRYRTFKTLLFISMGVFGVIPLSHLLLHFGELHFIFWYLLGMGASYVGGAIVYLFHIPERWFPGKVDLFLHSHNVWHVMIFIAVLIHYYGVLRFYEWRFAQVCHSV